MGKVPHLICDDHHFCVEEYPAGCLVLIIMRLVWHGTTVEESDLSGLKYNKQMRSPGIKRFRLCNVAINNPGTTGVVYPLWFSDCPQILPQPI